MSQCMLGWVSAMKTSNNFVIVMCLNFLQPDSRIRPMNNLRAHQWRFIPIRISDTQFCNSSLLKKQNALCADSRSQVRPCASHEQQDQTTHIQRTRVPQPTDQSKQIIFEKATVPVKAAPRTERTISHSDGGKMLVTFSENGDI